MSNASTFSDNQTFNDNDTVGVGSPAHMHHGVMLAALFCYGTVFLLGTGGNVLVVHVVLANRYMRNAQNLFIVNLALSDLMMCLLSLPWTPLMTFNIWPFGRPLCHVFPFCMTAGVYVSTFTCTAIAINRYHLILHPTGKFVRNLTHAWYMIVIGGIWVLACTLSSPMAIFQTLAIDDHGAFCLESWPSQTLNQGYTLLNLTLQFLVPSIIISYCCIRLCIELIRRQRRKRRCQDRLTTALEAATGGIPSGSVWRANFSQGTALSRNRSSVKGKIVGLPSLFQDRTNKMMLAVILTFFFSWLPLNVIILMLVFGYTMSELFIFFFLAAHFVAMLSTCYNPFIYGYLNRNFQREFRRILCWWKNPEDGTGDAVTTYRMPLGQQRMQVLSRHETADFNVKGGLGNLKRSESVVSGASMLSDELGFAPISMDYIENEQVEPLNPEETEKTPQRLLSVHVLELPRRRSEQSSSFRKKLLTKGAVHRRNTLLLTELAMSHNIVIHIDPPTESNVSSVAVDSEQNSDITPTPAPVLNR